jgi:hypothetical protein
MSSAYVDVWQRANEQQHEPHDHRNDDHSVDDVLDHGFHRNVGVDQSQDDTDDA